MITQGHFLESYESKFCLINDHNFQFLKKNNPKFIFIAAAKVGGIYSNDKYKADFIYDNISIQNNIIHSSYKNKKNPPKRGVNL